MTESFVFGWALDGGGGGTPVEPDHVPEGPPVWLHFDYSKRDIAPALLGLGLPPRVVESLIRTDTRPRAAVLAEGILVLLRGVNMNPGSDPEDMVSLRLWIEPNRLITVRQRRLFAVQDVRDMLSEGEGPASVPSLVTAITERLADRISDFVDGIEERTVEFETVVEVDPPKGLRTRVSALRRQTAVVRRFLAPQRDALDALYRDSKTLLSADQAYAIREQADRIARYVEDLDLVRERSLVIQEELLNRIAQEQNARMYLLSIVAAIFLPITFITGLFGMNVAGLPGLENPEAFLLVAAVMAGVTVGMLVYLRVKRWM
ncbi:MAG: zinc transporter ZntB [Pseudomonadales bacterium]|jgi:zinc transporter